MRDGRLAFSGRLAALLASSDLHFVVTGGGGWLGRATLEMLDGALGEEGSSRIHVFGSSRRSLLLRSGTQLTIHPLGELTEHATLGRQRHLLAHYAFVTREHVAEYPIAEYVVRNQAITDVVAGHAARSRAVGVFMPSSGAVYRADGRLEDQVTADNPYGALKVAAERRFLDLAESVTGPRVVVARLFNLAGPFLNKPAHYALGSILTDIGRGGPIRIRATRPVIRSYVHVQDLVELAFAAMVDSEPLPIEPFDTAGEREIEVGELAAIAAAVLGQATMSIDRPPLIEDLPDRYVGNGTVMARLAAQYGIDPVPLEAQITDTAEYLGSSPLDPT